MSVRVGTHSKRGTLAEHPLAAMGLLAAALGCGSTDLSVLDPVAQDGDAQMPGVSADAGTDGTLYATDCASCPNSSVMCCTMTMIGGQAVAACNTRGECTVTVSIGTPTSDQ